MLKQKLILTCCVFLFAACATQKTDSQLEAKIKAEPPASTAEEIAERGAQTFINAPGLSADQRIKMLEVYNRTYNDAMAIRQDIGQSKSLLFKLAANKDVKSKEVGALKKRIVDLDQKRLKIMFKALADVQGIVGTGEGKEEIYKHLYDFEYPKPGFTLK